MVSGFTLILNSEDLRKIQLSPENSALNLNIDDDIWFSEPQDVNTDQKQMILEMINSACMDQVFVITRQGKSSHVSLWRAQELFDSNRNLLEIAPKILANPEEFVLYPMQTSLNSKVVVINPHKLSK